MKAKLTIDEVLQKAIAKEIESQQLYADLRRQMTGKVAKDTFQDMVQQEKGHQAQLEKYRRRELEEGALRRGEVVDYRIAEHFDQPDISSNMALKDIFLLAANRELASSEFYYHLARIHPEGKVKKLIEDLASQELQHKQRVEFLFNEVAFPQTDGG
ncbi:MAG: ferritin family protein [Chloroflexi bacterium]|nr:ferritin family protein [Chloroflexota bacterium]